TPLHNGGPPCMACHSIAGIGALGGGALGPDLTQTFDKYGNAGMASVLATLPFPTMKSIFEDKPLTPEEQANLMAFLQSSRVSQRSTEAIGQLALLAVGGLIVLLALTQLVWRSRLVSIRRSLVASSKR
ncbi:MAG: cytochrome C, partial [Dehalococcoidia bacterium]|nr:cytochrome C [Dehalococcoidia bacterium]